MPFAMIHTTVSVPATSLGSLVSRARSLDRVVFSIAALLLGLSAWHPGQGWEAARFAGRELGEIAPWLAISVFFAAGAKATGADATIARAFEGRQSRTVIMASLVGALSPFCSCGVIPLVAGLLAAGVPLAPVMAFWISSPLMDPGQFMITAAQLGWGFAVAKGLAAIGMGAASGFATIGLTRRGRLHQVLRVAPRICCGSALPARGPVVWRFWQESNRSQVFLTNAAATTWFLSRWLALAFVLEHIMLTWVPAAMVARWLGQDGPWAVPLAVLTGIPAYLNGFAAVPLVSGLIDLGMHPAAGLGFMLGGGVTSIPAMAAVYALVRPKVFGWYLTFAVSGALLASYAYAAVLSLL
jgi:uncharacterized membrane protein YraQ (UPF0718 family)